MKICLIAWMSVFLPGMMLPAAELHQAARAGDLTLLEKLLSTPLDVDLPDEVTSLTAWQVASMHGRKEAADLLVKAGADPARTGPVPEEVLDRILRKSVSPAGPGFAVLVARDGRILFERGYGQERPGKEVKITPQTVFRIGSVTKQFTAAAILLCEEEGRLRTTDALDRYFPDYPNGGNITLHHLLTHTSGIANYTSLPGFMPHVAEPGTPEQVIATFRDQPPDFAPGTAFAYCNSGYFLLGEIVRQVTGRPMEDLLRSRVFLPRQMWSIGAHRPSLGLANEAAGFAFEAGKWNASIDWHMSKAGGAGEFYATVGDLFRWNEAVFGGQVLRPASLARAHTPLEKTGPPGLSAAGRSYGYGWVIGEVRGLKSIWHNGGLHGFTSELRRFPDQKVTIVVLSNAAEPIGGLTTAQVAEMAARQFLWREMKPQPCFWDTPLEQGTTLAGYAGTYDFGGLGVLRCRIEKDRLQLRLASQPWSAVRASGKDQFRNEPVDATFEFHRDEKGAVNSVTLKQHGLDFTGSRFDENREGKLPAEKLLEMAGAYDLGFSRFVFRLNDAGSALLGRLGEQPEFSYHPVEGADNRLFCKEIRVELMFVRNETGKVTGLILQQAGAMAPGVKVEGR